MKHTDKSGHINGVPVTINMLDADENERVTSAVQKAITAIGGVVELDISEADKMRKLCASVRACFDEILGDDMGRKVCGQRDDLDVHTQAFLSLRAMAEQQRNTYIKRAAGTTQA